MSAIKMSALLLRVKTNYIKDMPNVFGEVGFASPMGAGSEV